MDAQSKEPKLHHELDQLEDLTKNLYSIFSGVGSSIKSALEEKDAELKALQEQNAQMQETVNAAAQSLRAALICLQGAAAVGAEDLAGTEAQVYLEQIAALEETAASLKQQLEQGEAEKQELIRLKEQLQKNDAASKAKLDKLIALYEEGGLSRGGGIDQERLDALAAENEALKEALAKKDIELAESRKKVSAQSQEIKDLNREMRKPLVQARLTHLEGLRELNKE
jgi:regulator of replication initiation timing